MGSAVIFSMYAYIYIYSLIFVYMLFRFRFLVFFLLWDEYRMALQDQRNNLRTTVFESAQMLNGLQNDDSTESSVPKFLAVQNMIEASLDYFQTGNLCSEDTYLPLECLNTSNEYTVVWLHFGDSLVDSIEADAKRKLEQVFHHIEVFTIMENCLDFLHQLDVTTTRLFLVTSCSYNGMVCIQSWR